MLTFVNQPYHPYAVRCRLNVVSFLQNPHKDTLELEIWGIVLCIWTVIYIGSPSQQRCMQYLVILDRILTAPYCMFFVLSIVISNDQLIWSIDVCEYSLHCPETTIINRYYYQSRYYCKHHILKEQMWKLMCKTIALVIYTRWNIPNHTTFMRHVCVMRTPATEMIDISNKR